ncbi:MAG: hypothetical protein C0622_10815 [Desulfuromonas sp.]|nr:MAG: hypothetical protein C0622_10815 [Desulfuromonas sp.]
MGKMTDLGLTLFSLEKCHRVVTQEDFQILYGDASMASLFPGLSTGSFLTLFAEEEQEELKIEVQYLKPLNVACCVLETLAGVPLELMILKREEGLEILCRDISSRMRTLEQQMYLFRYFLTTPVSICITDAEGNILNVNQAFLNLYGYQASEVIGQNPRILKSGRQAPRLYETMWERLLDPALGSWSGELLNRKSNGEEITVMISISSVRNSNGTILGYIGSAFDVSRQKWLEQNLRNLNHRLNETSRLKSELMAITSHDLKSPVHAIVSRAALIKETMGSLSQEKLAEQVDKIIEAGKKMGSFIDDLLDLEKAEAGQVYLATERLRMDRLLRGCVDSIRPSAGSKQIALSCNLATNPRPLRADRVKLEQVFTNLLANAIKFSPDESEISIAYRQEEGNEFIDITDQGPGIPEKDIAGIFDRFAQVRQKVARSTRAHGIGLGLNIVKRYVEMHEGTVDVSNNVDRGCTFTVTLPGCGKVASGADLAALIYDPENAVEDILHLSLENKDITCYLCHSLDEVQRMLHFEYPELVFVPNKYLTAEFTALVEESDLRGCGSKTLIIGIQTQKDNAPEPVGCFEVLETPILDMEMQTLVKDVISYLNRKNN